jgi:hypothetical protein
MVTIADKEVLHRIKAHLEYVTQDNRFHAIAQAHPATLQWALQEHNDGLSGQTGLYQWLHEEQGIYCITGKPGSGKSTLMKYLYQDERLTGALQAWAGDARLIKVAFYFWSSGHHLENSEEGFLRSSLYQVLNQEPSLAQALFQEQYQPGAQWSGFPTLRDSRRAFQRLVDSPTNTIKIALLIDGLDEIAGDLTEIVGSLIAVTASPNIKALVSCRPWSVFEEAFASCPSLRVEMHTYNDIAIFVNDRLAQQSRIADLSVGHTQQIQALLDEIVEKASGVFLWVYLVVQSLREGLQQYDNISDLERRLRCLPTDLASLYEHMLQRVSEQSKQRRIEASQILQLVVCSEEQGSRSLSTDVLARALASDDSSLIPRSVNAAEDIHSHYTTVVAGLLESRCGGLLEIREGHDANTVSFIHMSVRDYLLQKDVWTSITAATTDTDFDARATLLRTSVIRADEEEPGSQTLVSDPQRTVWRVNVPRSIFLVTRSLEGSGSGSSSSSTPTDAKGYISQENLAVEDFKRLTVGTIHPISAFRHWAIVVAYPDDILAGTMFELLRSGRFGGPLRSPSIILRETNCGVPIWRYGSFEGPTYLNDDAILDNGKVDRLARL